MPTWIALLRGVNVGAANRIAMADLRGLSGRLGHANVRTVLQSGTLVFDGADAAQAEAVVAADLEAAIAQAFRASIDVCVRSLDAWRGAIAANPFPVAAERDPAHLVLIALKQDPGPGAEARLQAAVCGPEVVRVVGREAFAVYPAGIGESKLTAAVIDRALGVRGTARNWNTVLKIAAAAG